MWGSNNLTMESYVHKYKKNEDYTTHTKNRKMNIKKISIPSIRFISIYLYRLCITFYTDIFVASIVTVGLKKCYTIQFSNIIIYMHWALQKEVKADRNLGVF